MATVPLDFLPPTIPGITKLHVYESVDEAGPYSEIDFTTVVGTYPDYITRYETTAASSATNWFSIAWEDANGYLTEQSQPIKGGSQTLLGTIIDRVLLRDSTLDENVVAQEAQGAIQYVLGDDVDPFDSTLSLSYRKLNGIVALVMARAYIVQAVIANASGSGTVDSATLGLISFKTSTTSSSTVAQTKLDVEALIEMANKDLGIATSFVLQLEDVTETYFESFDISRLTSGWVSIEP